MKWIDFCLVFIIGLFLIHVLNVLLFPLAIFSKTIRQTILFNCFLAIELLSKWEDKYGGKNV